MKKYLTVFSLSFQNEFTYRLNFILWRFRNVLRILMTFFLWNSIFLVQSQALGYTRDKMISYVFLVMIVQAFVMSAPSNDNIGSEISSGDLSNYLAKPFSYLKYWFTRDLSSKFLNIIFAAGEFLLLALIFQPQFSLSSSPVHALLGIILLVQAIIIYYLVTKIIVFVAFWVPENTWGLMFTFLVFMEILSGMIFPLDVLPKWGIDLVRLTPFPYLIYYPITAFVGKLAVAESIRAVAISLVWLIISYHLVQVTWRSGLKSYSAYGK